MTHFSAMEMSILVLVMLSVLSSFVQAYNCGNYWCTSGDYCCKSGTSTFCKSYYYSHSCHKVNKRTTTSSQTAEINTYSIIGISIGSLALVVGLLKICVRWCDRQKATGNDVHASRVATASTLMTQSGVNHLQLQATYQPAQVQCNNEQLVEAPYSLEAATQAKEEKSAVYSISPPSYSEVVAGQYGEAI